jgi:preprotein translocase subunit SecA
VLREDTPLHYAIIDEVDSILIDEARTPLIISGPAELATDKYFVMAKLATKLEKGEAGEDKETPPTGDYTADEKTKDIHLTEQGIAKAEEALGVEDIFGTANMELGHMLRQALRAKEHYKLDQQYVKDDNGQIVIVDEFTGRLMPGRRFGEGLHQAIEAKEGVKIERENQTLATVTYQNFFKLYDKIAGMTGTAKTEEKEFQEIYRSDVLVIPTNKPMIRKDHEDIVYRTQDGKYAAVVEEIVEVHKTGQPILVGTVTIEASERLSKMLMRKGVKHQVLNAKHHQREAEIVSQAGRIGAVTISTNMAGRGTDIVLGGNPEALARQLLEREGFDRYDSDTELFIKALMLHREDEAREHRPAARGPARGHHGAHRAAARRGRARPREGRRARRPAHHRHRAPRVAAHRQPAARPRRPPGRPGQQPLLRLVRGRPDAPVRQRTGAGHDGPARHGRQRADRGEDGDRRHRARPEARRGPQLRHPQAAARLRQRDEQAARGHLPQRREILLGNDISDDVQDMIAEYVDAQVQRQLNPELEPEERDVGALRTAVLEAVPQIEGFDFEALRETPPDEATQALVPAIEEAYAAREAELGAPLLRELERFIVLQVVDQHWKEQLHAMDVLRQGIGLRGYGQRNPLQEYAFEAFNLFEEMKGNIRLNVAKLLFRVQVQTNQRLERRRRAPRSRSTPAAACRALAAAAGRAPPAGATKTAPITVEEKVGRNDPCPCGSRQEVQALPRPWRRGLRPARARRPRPAIRGRGSSPASPPGSTPACARSTPASASASTRGRTAHPSTHPDAPRHDPAARRGRWWPTSATCSTPPTT